MATNDPIKSVENIVQLQSARRPFAVQVTPAPRSQQMPPILFASWVAARDRAASALLSGTKRLLLTGPAGTGKTVLVEHVARVLRAAGRTVIIQLADTDPEPPVSGMTLFVDEADRLSATKLRELFEQSAGTVVLAGLTPIARRVAAGTVQVTLDVLDQTEAQDYLAQWLALNGRIPAELDSKAVRALVELSGGVPRLLTTLLAAGAWLAKSAGSPVIEASHIQEAAELRSVLGPTAAPIEIDDSRTPARGGRLTWLPLACTLLIGTAAAIAPILFPAETERAVASVAPFVDRAERWLRTPQILPLPQAAPTPIEAAPAVLPKTTATPEPAQKPADVVPDLPQPPRYPRSNSLNQLRRRLKRSWRPRPTYRSKPSNSCRGGGGKCSRSTMYRQRGCCSGEPPRAVVRTPWWSSGKPTTRRS